MLLLWSALAFLIPRFRSARAAVYRALSPDLKAVGVEECTDMVGHPGFLVWENPNGFAHSHISDTFPTPGVQISPNPSG